MYPTLFQLIDSSDANGVLSFTYLGESRDKGLASVQTGYAAAASTKPVAVAAKTKRMAP